MVEEGQAQTTPAEDALVITRLFDAPRELVWKAWTEPEMFKRWYGPTGFATPVADIDLRVGGRFLKCMRAPDGNEMWFTGVYHEIVEPERIVFTESLADEKGNTVPPSRYGMPGETPLEMLITVTFEDVDGKTRMTLRQEGFPSAEYRDGAGGGWGQAFDKLAAELALA